MIESVNDFMSMIVIILTILIGFYFLLKNMIKKKFLPKSENEYYTLIGAMIDERTKRKEKKHYYDSRKY